MPARIHGLPAACEKMFLVSLKSMNDPPYWRAIYNVFSIGLTLPTSGPPGGSREEGEMSGFFWEAEQLLPGCSWGSAAWHLQPFGIPR